MKTTERKIMCVCVCLWDRWCWWCWNWNSVFSNWSPQVRVKFMADEYSACHWAGAFCQDHLKESLRCQKDRCLLRYVISIIKRHFVYTQHCLPWPPTRKYLRVLICDWQLNDKNLERLMSIRKLIQLHYISFQRETNKRKKNGIEYV